MRRLPVQLLVSLVFLLFTTLLPAADRWEMQYLYDENGSSLVISDLKFPSARRGIAAGYILRKGKASPTVLVTSDGGVKWTQVPVKEEPYSLFFLDETIGWMVTEKGLWQTDESGRTWRKLPNFPKEITRVHFLDRKHGWAIGAKMQILETTDGGATWAPIPALSALTVNPEFTVFGWMAFSSSRNGIIAGWNTPPRRAGVPDWMDPQKAQTRRLVPNTLVLLQTTNGGKTWESSTASIFGRVTRVSLTPGGDSLGLVEFGDNFQWPSEVYRFRAGMGDSTRIFRKADRLTTDILLTESGTAYLAGIEMKTAVRENPVPGKLTVIRLDASAKPEDIKPEEMPVDYRANAHSVVIASAPAAGSLEPNIWVATDTGMILKLVTSAAATAGK
jgi:hypothetical protein